MNRGPNSAVPIPYLNSQRQKLFWVKVKISENGCWLWTAGRNGKYGKITFALGRKLRTFAAHRVSYFLCRGQRNINSQLDHLCHNQLCVNPAHLEPVTMRENILRSDGVTARHARKTACIRGHEFNEANTYRRANNGRRCRACHKIDQQKYLERLES